MNIGDKVYYIETGNVIKEAEIVKIADGFATVRYDLTDPHYLEGGKGHLVKTGGLRLRTSRLFEEKDQAEAFIKYKDEKNKERKHALETSRILDSFK